MDWDWDFMKDDLEEIKQAIESGGVQECRKLMEQKRDGWRLIPLNVAVIGNSGVGKSSFINAIRRLSADDEGGAVENILQSLLLRYGISDNAKLRRNSLSSLLTLIPTWAIWCSGNTPKTRVE